MLSHISDDVVAAISVKVGVLSMWGICVPLAYFLGIHQGLGLPGIWIAFIVDPVV
ncbi:hypothetical protein [Neobacillus vireti]|uniref:hypothetical protein n=1 Tax=Neobacillus vireti TaxID=220686 RepID=UPI002FFE6709